MTATAYETHRQKMAQQSRDQSRAGRDIGKIPPIADRARRAKCRRSFTDFCKTYFPAKFSLAWSDDHLRVADKIEDVVLTGGTLAMAMPRGSGKTTLCVAAVKWGLLYGLHEGVALIGATEKHAGEMLESIQTEFENNSLLLADFPEVCYPIRCLEGIKQRRLIHKGAAVRMELTSDRIVLPSTAKAAAESYVMVAGITGRVRGMKYTRADGKDVRPSLIILDDPQTDESAKSVSQSRQREKIIRTAVMGLAGPDKMISGIMPCTIIEPEDLADRLLDRKRNPQWQGQRTQLVNAWPTEMKLWEDYWSLRAEGLRNDQGTAEATEFYRQHQEQMDAGSDVPWAARFKPGEISALQSAMNLRQDVGEEAVDAEYQNKPRRPADDDEFKRLTASEVTERLNRIPRGLVPVGCTVLTSMFDVHDALLYWMVCGWEPDFTGYIIDYGCWPEQGGKSYYQLREANPTLISVSGGRPLEGAVYSGLETLAAKILGREWQRDDGAALRISSAMVDANYGPLSEMVYKFCRSSQYAHVIRPSHGKGITADDNPMAFWKHPEGTTLGLNWRESKSDKGKAIPHILFDTNWWKAFVYSRLRGIFPDRHSISINGEKPHEHKMLADQLTSEMPNKTTGRGRTVITWALPANRPDNHLWDCLIGCAVAASKAGILLPGHESRERPKRTHSAARTQVNFRAPEGRNSFFITDR